MPLFISDWRFGYRMNECAFQNDPGMENINPAATLAQTEDITAPDL